jgi:hypothetical protein
MRATAALDERAAHTVLASAPMRVLLMNQSRALRERSGLARVSAAANCERSERLGARSATHRTVLSKSHQRFTTTVPPIEPPALTCPSCDHPLKYDHSHIGGVSDRHAEQWDYFACSTCGPFQYRHRTRKLRRVH